MSESAAALNQRYLNEMTEADEATTVGRRTYCDDLAGPCVDTLRARCDSH